MKKLYTLFSIAMLLFVAAEGFAQNPTPIRHKIRVQTGIPVFSINDITVNVGDTLHFWLTNSTDQTLKLNDFPSGAQPFDTTLSEEGEGHGLRYIVTVPGGYEVTTTALLGVSSFNFDAIGDPLATNDAAALNGISFFPNPAKERINVALNAEQEYTLSVTNLAGMVLSSSKASNVSNAELNISNLEKGSYLLNIANGKSANRAFKFVKE